MDLIVGNTNKQKMDSNVLAAQIFDPTWTTISVYAIQSYLLSEMNVSLNVLITVRHSQM